MNNVSLVGRLTKDAELRTISTGAVTTTVTVAINRTFTNSEGVREADFIQVVVWNRQAENLAKYQKKGSLIGVNGRIQTRTYDKDDGTRQYITEVVADNIQFLGSKGDNVETTNVSPSVSEDPFKDFGSEVVLSDDDLPF